MTSSGSGRISRQQAAASSRSAEPFLAASLPTASTIGRPRSGSPGRNGTAGVSAATVPRKRLPRKRDPRKRDPRDQRAADPAGAGGAHAVFQVRRHAQHRVRAAGDDQLEHPVDRAGDAARGGRVVHGDDQGGPGVVDAGRANAAAIAVSAPARSPCACTTSGRQAAISLRSRAIARRSRGTRGRSAISTGVNPTGHGAEREVAVGLRRAEHFGLHAPRRAAAGEHPDVPGGAAGAGAEHERDLHGRTTPAQATARRSPPSATATTARKATSTAPLASSVTATLGRKPLDRRRATRPARRRRRPAPRPARRARRARSRAARPGRGTGGPG